MKMPLKFCLAVFFVAAFSPVSRTQSASTVLDFEGLADGSAFIGQAPGAAFTNSTILTSGVSLNEFEFPPHSGINVASDSGGPISVSFNTPVKVVSAYFTYAAAVTIRAFDGNNFQVAMATSLFANNEALSGTVGSAPNELISVSFPAGIARVTITGSAGGSSFAMDDFTVMPPLVAPTAPVGPPPGEPLSVTSGFTLDTVPLGSTVSHTLTATGGVPPYTWAGQGLPTGITVTAAGQITGKPTQPGAYVFAVLVTDSAGQTQGIYENLSVFGITTAVLPDAVAYAPYSQQIAATGGVQPYTFSGSGFPPGMSINSIGVIGGAATKPGSYQLLIQAKDAKGLVTPAVLSLKVGPPAPLVVPPATLPSGIIGTNYTQALAATGGAPPYSWNVIGGALPAGLRLSTPGTVSGIPNASGKFIFAAQATDSNGTVASGTISMTIAPPSLTLSAPTTLPSGMAGVDYPIQILTATGGTPPYVFSLASGTLPAGLNLSTDGVISGVPSSAGTSSFTVGAADSLGASATVILSATIRPVTTGLLLSAGSIAFTGVAGSTQLPSAQTIQVQSSVVGTPLAWSASVSPVVPWLSVLPNSGATPGSFAVALTSQALSLAASATPYQTSVIVTCTAPSSCQGNTQTLNVSLTVSSAPPLLSFSSGLLAFLASSQAPQASSQTLTVQNAGGGSIGFGSFSSPVSWLRVGAFPGAISSGQQASVAITADPGGLSPGFYRTALTITSSVGATSIPVTLFVASTPAMTLSSMGAQVSIASGGAPAIANNSFLVGIPGDSLSNWTATVLPGATWLSTSTPTGTSSGVSPGVVSFVIDPVVAPALPPGIYYGAIRVASPQVFDSPLDFQVVLNVGPPSAPTIPTLSSDGLVFIASAATSPAPQTIQVFSTSTASTSYQASATTADGHAWLSVSPSTAMAAPGASAQSQVSVNPNGLVNGVYYGALSYAATGAVIRTANVTLIVATPSSSTCTPSQLAPARVSLLNNFAVVASRPTPLAVQILNDCGTPVTNALASAVFSNGDIPVALALANSSTGLYSGTWYPHQATAHATVTLSATAPGLSAASVQWTGTVRPGSAPTLSPFSTLHIFAPQVAAAVAPGTIVQIYGSNLASSTASAASIPLATSLGSTSVSIGGIPAPLFYVSPTQVNAQVPFELAAEGQYQVELNNNGILSQPDTLHVSPVSPGLAVFPTGTVIAQHPDGSLVSEQSPAKPGEAIVLYAAGLGATIPPVATGAGSPSNQLASPQVTPVLLVGTASAAVQFVGLTPGLVGLYQINATVPASAPNGDLNLVFSQGMQVSPPAILPVHN